MNDNNERNLSGTPKQVAWANDILNKWEEKWFGTIFEEPYKKFISKYTHAGNIIDLMHKGFFKKIVKKHFNISSIALVVPNELVKSISSYREGDTLRRVILELPADIRYVLYDWCNLTYKEGFAKKVSASILRRMRMPSLRKTVSLSFLSNLTGNLMTSEWVVMVTSELTIKSSISVTKMETPRPISIITREL